MTKDIKGNWIYVVTINLTNDKQELPVEKINSKNF